MRIVIKRCLAVVLICVLFVSMSGCAEEPASIFGFSLPDTVETTDYGFAASSDVPLSLSSEAAERIYEAIGHTDSHYTYSHLYQLDEVKERLQFDATVDSHSRLLPLQGGDLSAKALRKRVLANNKAFLKTADSKKYTAIDKKPLLEICSLIVQAVNAMQTKYPQLDRERIRCNLGNLKILFRFGMYSLAEVTANGVLAININHEDMMETTNGLRNVIIHETMHVLQLGCSCEDIPNCERRAGASVYWTDFPLNTTDWPWLTETAAERFMTALTGDEGVSYQNKVEFLSTATLSLLINDTVSPDTLESLTLQSDPSAYYTVFNCKTQAEKDEILNMLITANISLMRPLAFYETYEDAYSVEGTDYKTRLGYELLPSVFITLSKAFYRSIVSYIQEHTVTKEDLYCLLTVFEGSVSQLLQWDNAEREAYNRVFSDAYLPLRQVLLDALEITDYGDYHLFDESGNVNASLTDLPEEDRQFLAQRCTWLKEPKGISVSKG